MSQHEAGPPVLLTFEFLSRREDFGLSESSVSLLRRSCVSSPRVAAHRGYPGETAEGMPVPQRGCVSPAVGRNPVGVQGDLAFLPQGKLALLATLGDETQLLRSTGRLSSWRMSDIANRFGLRAKPALYIPTRNPNRRATCSTLQPAGGSFPSRGRLQRADFQSR